MRRLSIYSSPYVWASNCRHFLILGTLYRFNFGSMFWNLSQRLSVSPCSTRILTKDNGEKFCDAT